MDAIHGAFPLRLAGSDGGVNAVAVGELFLLDAQAVEFALETAAAVVVEAGTLSLTRVWGFRSALEAVFAAPLAIATAIAAIYLLWDPREGRSDLIVWQVALPAVGKERQDSRNPLGAGCFAGADRNQKLHQVVVHLSPAALNNKDIFPAHRLNNLDSCLTDRKLGEVNLGGFNAEVGADAIGELRVGGAAQDDDVPDHVGVDSSTRWRYRSKLYCKFLSAFCKLVSAIEVGEAACQLEH